MLSHALRFLVLIMILAIGVGCGSTEVHRTDNGITIITRSPSANKSCADAADACHAKCMDQYRNPMAMMNCHEACNKKYLECENAGGQAQ